MDNKMIVREITVKNFLDLLGIDPDDVVSVSGDFSTNRSPNNSVITISGDISFTRKELAYVAKQKYIKKVADGLYIRGELRTWLERTLEYLLDDPTILDEFSFSDVKRYFDSQNYYYDPSCRKKIGKLVHDRGLAKSLRNYLMQVARDWEDSFDE